MDPGSTVSRPRTALITGVAGQDGIYLARLLDAEGVSVVGTVRPGGSRDPRVAAYLAGRPRIRIVEVDVTHAQAVQRLILETQPQEIYNLAAVSSVAQSWQQPELTRAVNHQAVLTVLDSMVQLAAAGHSPRLFQASSAETGAGAATSPYAAAKSEALAAIRRAREEQGLFAACAELHNHESPLRPTRFVTRKVTAAAAEIASGRRDTLALGNLEVRRDWGFAGEYVTAMRAMLRLREPVDLVLGTGVTHSLAELVETAMAAAGVGDPWLHVEHDPALVRPVDTPVLAADPEPAQRILGWRASLSFEEFVRSMVEADLDRLRRGIEHDPRFLEIHSQTREQTDQPSG